MRVGILLLFLVVSVSMKRTPKSWLTSIAMSDCKSCFANVPNQGYMWFFDSVFGMVCTNTSVFVPEYAVVYSCYWAQCQELEFSRFEDEEPVIQCDTGIPVTSTEEPNDWVILKKYGYIRNATKNLPMVEGENDKAAKKAMGMNPCIAGVWRL